MATQTTPDTGRIHSDPAVMVGKPVVRGTRIPVTLVLEHLAYTLDINDLFAAYPHLTVDDVKAVLAFAHDAVEADYRQSRGGAVDDPEIW